MKNKKVQIALSAVSLFSVLAMTTVVKAGPVRLNEVVQVVNSNPQNVGKNGVTELRVSQQEDPPKTKTPATTTPTTTTTETVTPQQQDGNNFPPSPQTRVQDESGEIVEITEEQCACDGLNLPVVEEAKRRGFPFYLLGIGAAAIPLIYLLSRGNDDNPPTTPPIVVVDTPTPTMSPSVPGTTPTPEPLSILLFGTGLAGLAAAARRRFKGKNLDSNIGI